MKGLIIVHNKIRITQKTYNLVLMIKKIIVIHSKMKIIKILKRRINQMEKRILKIDRYHYRFP